MGWNKYGMDGHWCANGASVSHRDRVTDEEFNARHQKVRTHKGALPGEDHGSHDEEIELFELLERAAAIRLLLPQRQSE
jgi:hypothetical protein